MGPWIMFLFVDLLLLYFIAVALLRPAVIVGWLGPRFRSRLDRQFRYRAAVRLAGVVCIVLLVLLNWLLWRWAL